MASVLARHQQLADSPFPPPRALIESIHDPASIWVGDPAVGARLAELWPGYATQADAWKRRYTLVADPTRLAPAEHRRLWGQLARYRVQLPPLRFYLVESPQVVLDVLLPETALLGTRAGVLAPSGYAATVLRTAALLAQGQLEQGTAAKSR